MSERTRTDLTALDIVDDLEDLVSSARRVPLSANVIVNEDETLELIDRLRLRLPDELTHARHTLEGRARVASGGGTGPGGRGTGGLSSPARGDRSCGRDGDPECHHPAGTGARSAAACRG